jgi:hypothetical protein
MAGPMARFFTGEGDTYENAEDKDTWLKETTSGAYDWGTTAWIWGGAEGGATAVEASTRAETKGKSKDGVGSPYETDTGYKLAQQRVVEEAAGCKKAAGQRECK